MWHGGSPAGKGRYRGGKTVALKEGRTAAAALSIRTPLRLSSSNSRVQQLTSAPPSLDTRDGEGELPTQMTFLASSRGRLPDKELDDDASAESTVGLCLTCPWWRKTGAGEEQRGVSVVNGIR